MIQPQDQQDLEVGQIRVHESRTGRALYLMLGPRANGGAWWKWDICVISVEGKCAEYVRLGVTDHPASWLLEESTVLA
jgi:hypothetical protein